MTAPTCACGCALVVDTGSYWAREECLWRWSRQVNEQPAPQAAGMFAAIAADMEHISAAITAQTATAQQPGFTVDDLVDQSWSKRSKSRPRTSGGLHLRMRRFCRSHPHFRRRSIRRSVRGSIRMEDTQ